MESQEEEVNDELYALQFLYFGVPIFLVAVGYLLYYFFAEGKFYTGPFAGIIEGFLLMVIGHQSSKRNWFRSFSGYGFYAEWFWFPYICGALGLIFYGLDTLIGAFSLPFISK